MRINDYTPVLGLQVAGGLPAVMTDMGRATYDVMVFAPGNELAGVYTVSSVGRKHSDAHAAFKGAQKPDRWGVWRTVSVPQSELPFKPNAGKRAAIACAEHVLKHYSTGMGGDADVSWDMLSLKRDLLAARVDELYAGARKAAATGADSDFEDTTYMLHSHETAYREREAVHMTMRRIEDNAPVSYGDYPGSYAWVTSREMGHA